MAFLEVEHLKYRYPHTKKLALDDISFTAEKGEFIGIIGENGAGKSTLSQAFCGLVPQFYKGAYGGKVTVDGIVAATTPTAELCKKVGLIFQNPFNQLSGAKDTVWDEVAFGLENFGVPAEQIQERLDKVLHQLDIWQFREKNPFDLSGGQMQRVAIASVLAMEPEILLLDEPTSQLDPQGSEEVFHTVELLAQTGITIFMIEQKMEKLASYCDKILLLHEGKQIAFDTPEKIFSRPDLAELGICPPYVTRYCIEQHLLRPDGTYPVVVEDVKEALKRDKERKVTLPQLADTVLAEAPENRFDVRNLKFSYTEDHPIFENFQLSLDQRPTAIIGQNGAGKTTLVRLLKGLLKPSAGTILYQGEDISRRTVASLAGQVGYVFQNPDDQIFKYKVIDEVMFGPLNIGMPKEKAMQKAMEALALTELTSYADENPYDLELSQRKLVAIASVLAMDTDVIILDEPTIAQDYRGKEIIRKIIASLSEQGKLVLAILHDMDFVAQCFSRVVVLAHGQLLADGTPSEVFVQEDVLKKAALDMPHPLQLRKALEQIE
jgi:energy-coupling factor transport system ATP-binding protein